MEAARREPRETTLGCDSQSGFESVADAGELQRKIGEARRDAGNDGGEMRPMIHESEGVIAQGMAVVLVVVGEEFGLIGGDVDIDGTLGFAGLAGKAEIERLFYRFTRPFAGHGFAGSFPPEDIALKHLPEQMSASAR